MGNGSRVDAEEWFSFGRVGGGKLGAAVLFCWFLFFRLSACDWTHIRARASQVLSHWAAALVQEEGLFHRQQDKRAANYVGRWAWEALTMETTDWTLWSHYKQWDLVQLWVGIKSERVWAEELGLLFLSSENSSFPTSNPRAELHYFTEYLRVKRKTQHTVGKKILLNKWDFVCLNFLEILLLLQQSGDKSNAQFHLNCSIFPSNRLFFNNCVWCTLYYSKPTHISF